MDTAARNAEIVAAIARNVPRGELATRHNLSRTRIQQIAKAGGAALRRSPHRFASSNWPSDHVATLKRMWGKAAIARIAQRLGRTRNAVIGKARRLGLARLAPPRRGPHAQRKHAEVAS